MGEYVFVLGMSVSQGFGKFKCRVEVEADEDAEDLELVEEELLSRDGITEEFIDRLSWIECSVVRESGGQVTYEANASVVWKDQ